MRGIERVCWISRTSGRSLGRLFVLGVDLVREAAFCRIRARGKVERSASSTSISFEERDECDPADDRRLRFAGREDGRAHSGTGFNLSNCLLKRFVYSPPLTISSVSLTLSFRNRASPAKDIANRSSSLSSQASFSSPEALEGIGSTVDGPASRKKS